MDRLSALISRFQMRVLPTAPETANLLVETGPDGQAETLVLLPTTDGVRDAGGHRFGLLAGSFAFALRVDWAGPHNPLVSALPARVSLPLKDAPDLLAVVALIEQELTNHRCGAETVLSSLGQALMIRLLRHLLEAGTARPGLLSGLSDARLARAIVAVHDAPGRGWTTGALADVAGLSPSRFSELFSAQMGESPMAYLRRWRLTLARQDLLRGDRVEAVARRYAYETPEGFNRAFRKVYGLAPIDLRKQFA